MLKIKLLFSMLLLLAAATLNAQERSAFRSGYLRVGLNTLGEDLDIILSPKQNIFNGNYGASRGYVFEFGRIFYFGSKATKSIINLGLDWTILSFNYNKLDKWEAYGNSNASQNVYTDGTKIAGAISSKLGPVLSLNLIEKVVIDGRFQLAPMLRFYDFSYSANEGLPTEQYFSFTNYAEEDLQDGFDAESVKNRLAFGIARSIGVTLRRKTLGLSVDYVIGDVKSNYEAIVDGSATSGKIKIPAKNMQVKLNFTF